MSLDIWTEFWVPSTAKKCRKCCSKCSFLWHIMITKGPWPWTQVLRSIFAECLWYYGLASYRLKVLLLYGIHNRTDKEWCSCCIHRYNTHRTGGTTTTGMTISVSGHSGMTSRWLLFLWTCSNNIWSRCFHRRNDSSLNGSNLRGNPDVGVVCDRSLLSGTMMPIKVLLLS